MVGVELTPTSKAALHWAGELRAIGPCELLVAQIAWPAEEHHRIGVSTPMPLDHLRPELEQVLLRDLEQWAGEQPGPGVRSFVVKPGWGRVDSHLTQLAAESKVDLLVVGTHQRAGIARLWQDRSPACTECLDRSDRSSRAGGPPWEAARPVDVSVAAGR